MRKKKKNWIDCYFSFLKLLRLLKKFCEKKKFFFFKKRIKKKKKSKFNQSFFFFFNFYCKIQGEDIFFLLKKKTYAGTRTRTRFRKWKKK